MNCLVCNKELELITRIQGGGTPRKYCSNRCRNKRWTTKEGLEKRRAILKRYEAKPENMIKKQERNRKAKLKKYGITEEAFQKQLERQNFSCGGCLTKINRATARIDHCHKTNKFRGLLCDSCNWALGHIKDSPETLRRLMAYLDKDLNKTLIYLIGQLKNERIIEIGNLLRSKGFDVMDEWITPGAEADENWQKYEAKRGRNYKEALRGRAATNTFLFDRSYLDMADIAIVVAPFGKSAMIEAGYSKGRNKKVILFLDGQEPDRYDVMPNFVDQVCKTEQELLAILPNN